MAIEIDILAQAAGKGCAVIEKTSHRLWDKDDLVEAKGAGCFRDEDSLDEPPQQIDISGPYPGCLQQYAASAEANYRLVGQTKHFLVFAPPPARTRADQTARP
jgi:hypothetical protein